MGLRSLLFLLMMGALPYLAGSDLDTSGKISAMIGDETGSGNLVFNQAPTLDSAWLTTKVRLPRVTAFPASPVSGDTVIVIDDSAAGACDSSAGSATTLCQYNGTGWVKLGDGGSGGISAGAATALQSSNGSGGFADSGCTATSGTMTCSGGFISGGAGVGILDMTEGTAPGAASTSGHHNLYINSANSTLETHENGGSVKTYLYSGGPIGAIPRRYWFPAAGCANATAGSVWDLPTASPAVAACKPGTNTQLGTLDFADGLNLSAQIHQALPTTWTGAIDVRVKWLSTATTGDVVWQVATSCVADAETDDPTFNAASTVTDTTKGTASQANDAAIPGVTATGCAAGELLHLKLFRDAAHASDTMAATARVIGLELTLRESL